MPSTTIQSNCFIGGVFGPDDLVFGDIDRLRERIERDGAQAKAGTLTPHEMVFGSVCLLLVKIMTAPDLNAERAQLVRSLNNVLSWEAWEGDLRKSVEVVT